MLHRMTSSDELTEHAIGMERQDDRRNCTTVTERNQFRPSHQGSSQRKRAEIMRGKAFLVFAFT